MASASPSSNPCPKATCHCGRITIALPRSPEELNECRCSLCYRLGALWAYYPRDEVAVTATTCSPAFPTSTTTSHSSSWDTSGSWPKPKPITRGIVTSVDEALDSYVRTDLPDGRQGSVIFLRCAHCGCLTHWWGVRGGSESKGEDGSRMGVNCRLLPEREIAAVKRTVRDA
jgi:hypothetical protein